MNVKKMGKIIKSSWFLSYSDLKAAVESVFSKGYNDDQYEKKLEDELKDFSRTIKLNTYMNKEILDDTNIEEGLALLYLMGEADKTEIKKDACLKFGENIGKYFEKQGADIKNIEEELKKIAGKSVLGKVWKNVNESKFVDKIKCSYNKAKESDENQNTVQ